jgi:hypothetical protein
VVDPVELVAEVAEVLVRVSDRVFAARTAHVVVLISKLGFTLVLLCIEF